MNASGGIERVVSNLLEEWCKIYEVTILVKDDMESFYPIPDSVKLLSIYEPLELNMHDRASRILTVAKNIVRVIKKLRKFLKKEKFEYLYTATPLNSLEFYLASHDVMKRMVISEHASAFAVNKIYQCIKRFIYPKAYCISVPNRMDCDIPHLVTFSNNTRNKLDTKIILNIGRFTSDKRQDDLLRIWNNVKEKNGWKLWIVGSGEEKEKLLRLIEELNISDSVELIDHTKNIDVIYQKASIFVFTSRMEGFGMVLLEAMSFGIPCISYDCPSGPRDIIENGRNGYLIKNGDMTDFTSKINALINMESKLSILGAEAYSTARDWNNKEIVNKWKKVFG